MPAHCCIIWVESCYMSQWCYHKCSNLASSPKKKNWLGPLGICKALAETSLNHSPTFTSFSHMLNANLNASPSTSCVGSAHCWSVLRWSPWPVLRWWSGPTWSLGQYNPSQLPAMLKSRLKWKHQTTRMFPQKHESNHRNDAFNFWNSHPHFPLKRFFCISTNCNIVSPDRAPRLGCGWWHQDCRSCRFRSEETPGQHGVSHVIPMRPVKNGRFMP